MRKVKVDRELFDVVKKENVKDEFEGKFHCWGAEFEEFDSGPGNYTVAIVEDEKGQIFKVDPDHIQFLE